MQSRKLIEQLSLTIERDVTGLFCQVLPPNHQLTKSNRTLRRLILDIAHPHPANSVMNHSELETAALVLESIPQRVSRWCWIGLVIVFYRTFMCLSILCYHYRHYLSLSLIILLVSNQMLQLYVFPLHVSNALSIYALNANSLVHTGKLRHVCTAISQWQPHVFILSETKTSGQVGSKLQLDNKYMVYDEVGIKAENHYLYKWGVVVGMHKDIQLSCCIATSSTLQGQVIALDLVIGIISEKGFVHQIISAYAPWNPGAGPNPFWSEISVLCWTAPYSSGKIIWALVILKFSQRYPGLIRLVRLSEAQQIPYSVV